MRTDRLSMVSSRPIRGTRRQRKARAESLVTRRAALLGGAQALLLALLSGRLYQLQVSESDRYKMLADENRINLRLIAPLRGRILDRFGVALADNKQDYRLIIVPEQSPNISATLDAVATLIGLDEFNRGRVMREIRRGHSFIPVVVRDNLNWNEMAKIEIAAPELPGTSIEQGSTRHYPMGDLAAPVIGYVAAVSEQELDGDPLLELPDFRIGKAGLEKSQDLALRGTVGTRQVEVNAFGRVVRDLAVIDGTPGADIVIGLDQSMQQFVARCCANERSVSSVLLDAVTGEVLALVSLPSFDPSTFINGISVAAWQQLSADPRHPLSNKAIAGVYPPGSTFKPTVALAALTAGVITPETTITCSGQLQLGNAVFHCWRHGGHGPVRLHDAIKKSCDVFFYETARRLGISRLAEMARGLGFGARTGLDIPGESPGLLPTPAWKFATSGTEWQQGETVIAGVGQGFMLATPLQIATMVARLVSGRAIIPRLVRQKGAMRPDNARTQTDFPALDIDPDALSLVLQGMNAVVNEPGGTAYAARILEPGWAMGGKSGTSQVRRITEYQRDHGLPRSNEIPWKERDHALFVGFAPVSAPRYVCATVVEHGGGGSAVAAPICRDVLREAQRRDPLRHERVANAVARSAPPQPLRTVSI
jgi:penicillin-binding protein 2